VQEFAEEFYGHHDTLPAGTREVPGDLESGMPIASGNTLTHSTGVQGLSERVPAGDTILETNLPISSGADLRGENSNVGVAGLQPRP